MKLCQAKNRKCDILKLPEKLFNFSFLKRYWVAKADKIYIYTGGDSWYKGLHIEYMKIFDLGRSPEEMGRYTTHREIKRVDFPDVFTLD